MSELLHLTFANPVLKRELLSGLRSVRLRWILLLYVALPFVVLAWSWPLNSPYFGGSERSTEAWHTFLTVQCGLATLITPIFAAYLVSSEFEQRTADFLWTTRIPPWLIILSKLASVLVLALGLQLASLPALSLVFLLGGVDSREIVAGYGFLAALTLCAGSVAVAMSAGSRKGHASLVSTYVALGVPWLATWFVIFFPFTAGRLPVALEWGTAISVLTALPSILLACWYGSRPVGEKAKPNVKPVDNPDQLRRRRRTWPYYIVDPLKRWPAMPDSARGVKVIAAIEPQVNAIHRGEWGIRCLYTMTTLSVIPLLLVLVMDGRGGRGLTLFLWWVNFLLAAGYTVLLHAVSTTQDHALGTLDGLRSTLIGPREFLLGKWLASLRMRRWILISGVVTLTLACATESSERSWYWVNERAFLIPRALIPLGWIIAVEFVGWVAFAVSSHVKQTMLALALSLVASCCAAWGGAFLCHGRAGDALIQWIQDFRLLLLGSWWFGDINLMVDTQLLEPLLLMLKRMGDQLDTALLLASPLFLAGLIWLALHGVRRKWRHERG